jgi:hypothetical protein
MLVMAMVLVELFTSQGCSSCPPADALLAVLDKNPDVLVLSEHVDYWNHLGWKDPYSSAVFSERQQRYARRYGLEGPYTPQMVVDGGAQFVGSDGRQARSAISAAGRAPKQPVQLARENGRVRVTVGVLDKAKRAELWVALVRTEGAAEVARGENAGRQLRHVAIVRTLVRAGVATRTEGVSYAFPLPPEESGPWRVVAFLQEPGQGAVIGAGRL